MQGKSASSQYRNVQVSTVDRGRLLLMMYDGGLKFLHQAKDGLVKNDIVKFAKFLSKGQAIIAELANTLDFEAGGDIAKELDRLYDFMLFYLTEANIEKSPAKIQQVIDLLETVANAYREIISKGAVKEALDSPLDKPKSKAPKNSTGYADESKKKAAKSEELTGNTLRVSL